MGYLQGLSDYLASGQPPDIFETFLQSGESVLLHHCDTTEIVGTLVDVLPYDVTVRVAEPPAEVETGAPSESAEGSAPETDSGIAPKTVPKVEILFVARAADRSEIAAKRKGTPKPADALYKIGGRHFIKNKTLFPLMMERQVVFLTLLDGTLLRGLVTGFNRYEIRMSLKGGTPVTVLRHGVWAAQTKVGRSLLKKDQSVFRDWKKSPLFIETPTQGRRRNDTAARTAPRA